MTQEKQYSIDRLAERFTNLIAHDDWQATRFLEENLNEKWLRSLLGLDHKSQTFAVEAAFLKGQIAAVTKINQDRAQCIEIHKVNLKKEADNEKKLSKEANTFRISFIGPKGEDYAAKKYKNKFL